MSSKTKIFLVVIIVLACLGFFFVPDLLEDKPESNPSVESQESQKLQVEAMLITNRSLEDNLRITGSLMANESVTLRSEVAGIVEKIHFKEGQRVRKGELLVELDNDEIIAEIQKLEYTQKLNKDIEFRQKQLLEKEAISQEEYETALTSLNTTLADLRLKEVQNAKRKIRAPFSGYIGLRSVSEGSYLSPTDNIATLYSINPIKVEFNVPGKYSAEVNEGDKLSFTVDGFSDTFGATIYAIEPQIDPRTRTLKVRAISQNKSGKLLPGQFAKIELTLNTIDSAIMIPTHAVIPELDSKKVFISSNGMAESKVIETGIRTADKIQVVSGLNEGDTLLTSGMLQLRPGMEVEANL